MRRHTPLMALILALAAPAAAQAPAPAKKPNILMIMGDDIGWFNPSAYHRGLMGYQTPNIDRIAAEGRTRTSFPHSPQPPAIRTS